MTGSDTRESKNPRRARRQKQPRHRWDKAGNWSGSRDVRTCQLCSLVVYKTGLYSGYRSRFKREPEAKERYSDRMPACIGRRSDKEATTGGNSR